MQCRHRTGPAQHLRATTLPGSPFPCSSPFALCGSLAHAIPYFRRWRARPCAPEVRRANSLRRGPRLPMSYRRQGGPGVRALTAAALARYIPPLMFSVKRVAQLFISSARRGGWLAPRNTTALGLVLIGLAASAMVYLLPSAEPVPGNTPAAASHRRHRRALCTWASPFRLPRRRSRSLMSRFRRQRLRCRKRWRGQTDTKQPNRALRTNGEW
jgi:hypothetical protein